MRGKNRIVQNAWYHALQWKARGFANKDQIDGKTTTLLFQVRKAVGTVPQGRKETKTKDWFENHHTGSVETFAL